MAVAAGTKLGPYELGNSVGSGGMGEVYRARDARLGRDVAIKILPGSYSADPERLHRFELEARAAAALNHPNILSVYDIGNQDGAPYIVSELLEGETLRARLKNGPLPIRKTLDYAMQVAHGLAAAHAKGIIHRDLKPENLFITKDGRAKILDFGLAKLTLADAARDDATQMHTELGKVVGTVGYMSPEQVRGRPADERTDLFSFGAILYEMLSSERAFHGDTEADTMTAILTREPPELTRANAAIPQALQQIVRRCLEKNPEERFHSAHDLAFDLGMLSSGSASATAIAPVAPAPKRRWATLAIAAVAVAMVAAAAFLGGRGSAPQSEPPVFHQLTFQRGWIDAASFAPDGHTIIYSAAWDGDPLQLFSTRDDSPGSIPLNLTKVNLLSVSPSGEMAVLLDRHSLSGWTVVGTLARLPLNSSAPRPVLEDVADMAWSPSGADFAVVRYVDERFQLEYPLGKVLYSTSGWISYPRFSPKGDQIAFMDHPLFGDDRGSISVVDLAGHKTNLTSTFASEAGLQWTPSGNEVWFTASDSGISTALFAVTPRGRKRAVARAPGRMILQDIAHDGRVLLRDESFRRGAFALGPGQDKEKNVAVLDWNLTYDISPDGEYVLSSEEGEGGGANYSIYLRKTDGSPPTRLGEGNAWALSADGKWVASTDLSGHAQITLLPTGAGQPRQVTHDQSDHLSVHFFPDGKRIAYTAVEPQGRPRVYVQDLNGGPARPLTPPGFTGGLVSPDGRWVLVRNRDKHWLYPAEGGEPRPVAGLNQKDGVAGWSADGTSLFLWTSDEIPGRIYRVNIVTGAREIIKQVAPSDPAGTLGLGPVLVTPSGKYYVYSFTRDLADLYVVTGLK